MEEKIVECAKVVIEAYNDGDYTEMERQSKFLSLCAHKNPTIFTRTKRTYLNSVALFYILQQGLNDDLEIIVMAYYCMLKTIRDSESLHDVTASSMLAFILLEDNKAEIGLNLFEQFIDKNIDDDEERTKIVINQIIGNLSMFYWTFNNADEKIFFDNETMRRLHQAVQKYSHKFQDSPDIEKQDLIKDFIMVNVDVLIKHLETYWALHED